MTRKQKISHFIIDAVFLFYILHQKMYQMYNSPLI